MLEYTQGIDCMNCIRLGNVN